MRGAARKAILLASVFTMVAAVVLVRRRYAGPTACPLMPCEQCGSECIRIENREGDPVHLLVFDVCREAGEVPQPLQLLEVWQGGQGVFLGNGDTICSKPVDDRLLRGELFGVHTEFDEEGNIVLDPRARLEMSDEYCGVGNGRVVCNFWALYPE